MNKLTCIFCLMLSLCFEATWAQSVLVVDQSGKGNFKSIQEAINSLPDSSATDRIIRIKKGTYHEKVFISKNHILLQGEGRDNTIITAAIARDIWACDNPSDWGAATLNLRGSDITLQNLSVINSYGFDKHADTVINCTNGKAGPPQRTVTRYGHQMALRSFSTTRLKAINCAFRAYGGDTVSPWNTSSGLFYFKDCVMEGGVDFYCPRGWAYAEGCTFMAHGNVAAIWHDGSGNKSQKTVLVNCKFSGEDGFKLGRYHRDAQFYLINCSFARNMADAPIYQAESSKGVQWGHRVYFYGCHRTGGDYSWFKDNLAAAPGNPSPQLINTQWAFDNQWKF